MNSELFSKPLYLIDGNNLLHIMLAENIIPVKTDFDQARRLLVSLLQDFAGTTDYRIVLVYDGTVGGKAPEYNIPGFEVVFSDAHSSADTIIENIAISASNKKNITVVTSDHAEADVVRAAGAFVISCRNFIDSLKAEKQGTQNFIKGHENKMRPFTLGDIFP